MRITKVLIGFVVLLVLASLAFSFLFERVPPTRIGVKQVQWSGGGVVTEDFDTGFHLGIAGYHKWYLLDRRTHFLTFSDSQASGDLTQQRPALVIRTRDGNETGVDVTVTYRIIPGEGHLMVSEGLRDVYVQRTIATIADVLSKQLPQLSSEEFYSTEMRMQRSSETLPVLREALARWHVEPESILIRAVSFLDPNYEERLQVKQLTYQTKLLAMAQQKVEKELQITGTLEKEIEAAEKEMRGTWDKQLQQVSSDNEVAISEILGDAEKYDLTTRAEAEADYDTMLAEGQLAIDKAEALRDELRNKALDTEGGSIFLAQLAAQNLNIDEVTLNSNDPRVPTVLDLGALVELLVGSGDGD